MIGIILSCSLYPVANIKLIHYNNCNNNYLFELLKNSHCQGHIIKFYLVRFCLYHPKDVSVFFGMLFNLMCECAQLFLAIARVPGAYLVLQYATTHTMPTTSSATQMPVIVSTRFWYSSSASEWTRAMDKHTHMHRRTQRQTHMYTTTIEHKATHTYKTHNRCISGSL